MRYVHTQRARAGHRRLAALLRGARLEGRSEPYDIGSGYGHMALSVEDLDGLLEKLAAAGIEPEKPPYHPGGREEFRICVVQDPDGYPSS